MKPDVLPELRPDETMILCTGSQGEPMSALTRMAYRDHPHVSIEDGVLIVVATVGFQNGGEIAAPEVISRGFAEMITVSPSRTPTWGWSP